MFKHLPQREDTSRCLCIVLYNITKHRLHVFCLLYCYFDAMFLAYNSNTRMSAKDLDDRNSSKIEAGSGGEAEEEVSLSL